MEPADPRADAASRRLLPWLLAAAGFALDLGAYWPGQVSFDSAYAWWQARGGETSDLVPPALVIVWRACEALHSGPGLVFALHLALFWSGLAAFARALRLRPVACAAAMALVAFAPVPWLLRAHVWTDVGLFSALLSATGVLACVQAGSARRWLWLALPPMFYAAALRHNALPALLPFAIWFARLALPADATRRPAKLATLAFGLLASMLATNHALSQSVQRRVPMWPSLAQFDLVAVSIATNRLLLPPATHAPGLTVAELARTFRPWSNTPMYAGLDHPLQQPFSIEPGSEAARALRRAWIDAILDHPGAWLAHRWRLTRALFGTHAADWPRELTYVEAPVAYRDNPPIARNGSALHGVLMRAAAALVATPWLAAWPHAVLGLLLAWPAWRRRDSTAGTVALVSLASATLLAAPLPFVAPAAELRYLGWSCVATLLALVALLAGSRPLRR